MTALTAVERVLTGRSQLAVVQHHESVVTATIEPSHAWVIDSTELAAQCPGRTLAAYG